MKLRVPNSCCAISHMGESLLIGEDGSIDMSEDDWPLLAPHGLRPWREDGTTHNTMVASRENATPTLKALLSKGAEDPVSIVVSEIAAPPTADPNAVVDVISTLNRQELFAFLRSKKISVSLPITNDELRALARRSIVYAL